MTVSSTDKALFEDEVPGPSDFEFWYYIKGWQLRQPLLIYSTRTAPPPGARWTFHLPLTVTFSRR